MKSLKIIIFLITLLIPFSTFAQAQFDTDWLFYGEPEGPMKRREEAMVFIKGGCFDMGDTFGDGDADEKPVHTVCVDDFYMGKYEVTVGEFRKFAEETGYRTEAERGDGCLYFDGKKWSKDKSMSWRNPGFSQTEKHPVACVSWNDAIEYTNWMGKKTGKTYRLPTEAEWEYAARSGGKNYKYSWGNGSPSGNIADEAAKRQFSNAHIWTGYDDGYVYTAPVGSFKANDLGLYDMSGNVWEWVSDWYGQDYYKQSPKDNPKGPSSGQYRVLRGGSWDGVPWVVRVANRFRSGPDVRTANSGSVWRCPPPSNNFLGSRVLFSGGCRGPGNFPLF